MKKSLAALALSLAMIPCMAMAAGKAPTSQKMLDDYGKYVVVYSSDDERVYADADTIERDPVSAGALPIIRATLYAEVYKDNLTYPDYGNYQIVDHILQYETAVGADQYGNEIKYRILNRLQGAYDADGRPIVYNNPKEDPADEAEDIYLTLYRLSKPD